MGEGVALPLEESEPVTEGEAPLESVAVGLLLTEELTLGREEGLPLPVPLTVALWLGVWLLLPVAEAVPVGL